ncbi:unnamed protein product [Vitrella brassicaformis CCMP3155]|uniref:Uncharacterized protein n=1 Tax=Vitrella brassicaformis (strain CCMP3155) TaxID=1169540 RepID=A0A0G4FFX5_VITBC|nr:unnamed protein product [Vitrella brassicaformis CCMP3155]|eukprot:CEM11761.1 unnamed protein product [Vitrella brassicaformis CCMP3155]
MCSLPPTPCTRSVIRSGGLVGLMWVRMMLSGDGEGARLNRKDRYGHRKLACEEWLSRWVCDGHGGRADGKPHSPPRIVALRLADVIGPYNDTYRFWAY